MSVQVKESSDVTLYNGMVSCPKWLNTKDPCRIGDVAYSKRSLVTTAKV